MTRAFLSLRSFWCRYTRTRTFNDAVTRCAILDSIGRHPAGKSRA